MFIKNHQESQGVTKHLKHCNSYDGFVSFHRSPRAHRSRSPPRRRYWSCFAALLTPCHVILGVRILRVSQGPWQLDVDLRDSKRQYVVLWLVESIISDLPVSAIYFNACYACFNDFGGTAECCWCNTDFILFDACICWFEDFFPCIVLHSAIVMYLLKGTCFAILIWFWPFLFKVHGTLGYHEQWSP